ncbi:MAG: amidophosphoribosyltransferase [Labilithrix sp.]|nr:amidophosphoribosyltransferase [Labilithrix sp.]MCW5812434.1 amidophosphoribosyltransferase [Labilithrix sp.]
MKRRLTVLDPAVVAGERRGPTIDEESDDHFHDQCGVFAIYGHGEAANITYLGLHALQHRGQESAGIVTSDGEQLYAHRAMGLVQDAFSADQLAKLPGRMAIGHVRYSTAGGSHLRNAQPFAVDYAKGSLAVCHNGNLTNADELRAELEAAGSIFSSTSDTEVLVHLVARSKEIAFEDRVVDALSRVHGAYSLLFLEGDSVIAVRDPRGIRPLCLGILPSRKDAHVIASEPISFDLIGAEYVRDVEPGEMLVIDASGIKSVRLPVNEVPKQCIFEWVYFARPDSSLAGRSVYEVRKELGRVLARESPVDADVVIPVPDSGVPSAIGYAGERRVPFEMGLIRSHYVGRTFIEPQQSIRHFGVRLKLNPVEPILKGKRVVVIDDSIVRGTTSRKIVKMVRDAGAREVHLRISSPPTQWPCYYGIDTPTRRELIASSHSVEEIARYVTADSLGYLSLEGMVNAVSAMGGPNAPDMPPSHFCHACFSGQYAIPFSPTNRRQMRLVGL